MVEPTQAGQEDQEEQSQQAQEGHGGAAGDRMAQGGRSLVRTAQQVHDITPHN